MRIVVFISFLCIVFSLKAQPFTSISPKNNQFVGNQIDFEWNEIDSIRNYLIVVDSSGNTAMDSLISENSISLEIPYGNYSWVVYAFFNGAIVDSTPRVRFTSFSPRSIDSLHLWLRSDSVGLSSANSVASWFDQSDSSFLLGQNNTSRQPSLINNVINGYDALRFDNQENFNNSNVIIDNVNYFISAVYAHKGPLNKQSRLIFGSSNWFLGSFGGEYLMFDGINVLRAGNTVQNRFVQHSVYSAVDTLSTYLNGTFKAQSNLGRTPQSIFISRAQGDFFEGDVTEIVMFNGSISKKNRADTDNYLMDKYAPPVNLGANRIVCSFPDSVQVDIDYALDFIWSTGDTTNKAIIDSAGKYYLTITDMFERTSVDSIFFDQDVSNFQLDFGFIDTTICLGDSIEIEAGPDRYQYLWSSGQTSQSVVLDSASIYYLTVTNCLSVVSVDSFYLRTNQPKFSLGNDTTACFNESLTVSPDSSFTNVNYLWSNGLTSSFILADSSQIYSLEVEDQFGCTYSDSILVTIDSSLLKISLGPDTSLCIGNEIGLVVTDSSIVSYLWSTGNQQMTQTIDTAGLYRLRVTNSFCSNRDSIQIGIKGDAPNPNFLFRNSCFEDTMLFNNISTAPAGDSIILNVWNYGGSTFDTIQNARYRFDDAKVYRVLLEVTTDKGCRDTLSKLVEIDPKPNADFTESNRCSKQEVNFTDQSSINNGIITAYKWDFGDSTNSSDTSISPFTRYTYDTLGVYNVRFQVFTSDGCSDTLEKQVAINPSPNLLYNYEGSCFGDSTSFFNQSTIANGTFKSYLWLMNGQQISEENPKVKFFSSGFNEFAFIVESDSNCVSSLLDTILISEKPMSDFISEDVCLGENMVLTDNSNVINDSIIQYSYFLKSTAFQDTSYHKDPIFNGLTIGDYNIKQIVVSSNLCTDSIEKNVKVKNVPTANYTILNNGSGAPYDLEIENNSVSNVFNKWFFGNGDSSDLQTPMYTYQDTGDYNIELIVRSANNCFDTISNILRVNSYYLDAFLNGVDLLEEEGAIKLRVGISNLGNNTIEEVELVASLNNAFMIQEKASNKIFKGNSSTYLFNSSFVIDNNNKVNFVCVKIGEVNGVKDDDLENNEDCKEGPSTQLFIKLYPVPTSDKLQMDYVLPTDGKLSVLVYDHIGREVLRLSDEDFYEKGLYSSVIDVSAFKTGIYVVSFLFNGVQESKTIIIQ